MKGTSAVAPELDIVSASIGLKKPPVLTVCIYGAQPTCESLLCINLCNPQQLCEGGSAVELARESRPSGLRHSRYTAVFQSDPSSECPRRYRGAAKKGLGPWVITSHSLVTPKFISPSQVCLLHCRPWASEMSNRPSE